MCLSQATHEHLVSALRLGPGEVMVPSRFEVSLHSCTESSPSRYRHPWQTSCPALRAFSRACVQRKQLGPDLGTSTYNFCRSFLTLHYFLNLGACKRFASFASAVAGAPNKTTNVGVAGAGWGWGREMAGTGGGGSGKTGVRPRTAAYCPERSSFALGSLFRCRSLRDTPNPI